jgi:hypothetical protein
VATFEEAMTPLVDAVESYIRATVAAREVTGGSPTATSPAMAELVDERSYAGDDTWGAQPLSIAYSYGRLQLIAAEDYLGAACRVVVDPAPSIYAHSVLVRAAIEASARCYWLLEPGIGTKRRIARAQTERIYSMKQEAAISSKAGKDRAESRIAALLAEAVRLNVKKRPAQKRRPPELEDERPGFTQAFIALFADDGLSDLGRALAGLQSAVAHSTAFGLLNSVDRDGLTTDPVSGATKGSVWVTSQGAGIALSGGLLGYARAVGRAAAYFGWRTERWDAEHVNALSAVRLFANLAAGERVVP